MNAPSHLNSPVVCAGEVLIDLIGWPSGPAGEVRHFMPRVGGAPANVAAGLARLGVRSAFVGATGDDEFGALCQQALAEVGVETHHLRRVAGMNTRLAVVTGPASDRSFRFYGQPAADELLTFNDMKSAINSEGCAALYFGALPLAGDPSRTALLEAIAWIGSLPEPIPFCFDPNPRQSMFEAQPKLKDLCLDLLGQARVVKVSRSDLCILGLSEDDLVRLARPDALVVITDGDRGCDYCIDGERGLQLAFPIRPMDETGAGDAFVAALIARGVAHDFRFTPDDIGFAAAAGALATTNVGAIGAMPTREKIDEAIYEVTGKRLPDQ